MSRAVWAIVLMASVIVSCFNIDGDPGIPFEEQWKQDTTIIAKYLRDNNIPALTDASGVRFIIDSLGSGFPPRTKSSVVFSYKGQLLDGTVFDQGTLSGAVKDYIAGFQVGLSLMPEGSKARIYIPSGYAYGASASSKVPANSNLIFNLKLIDVVVSDTEKQRLASDTVAIDEYLANNSINAIKDKSGLRYVINTLGSGAKPSLYSKVKIKYTGKLLTSGIEFYNGSSGPSTSFDSRVINYFYAFQAMLPKIPAGSKVTIYVPSGLGFGNEVITSGSVNVPANSNLIYEVELTEVIN